jgi:hypothetical protein
MSPRTQHFILFFPRSALPKNKKNPQIPPKEPSHNAAGELEFSNLKLCSSGLLHCAVGWVGSHIYPEDGGINLLQNIYIRL